VSDHGYTEKKTITIETKGGEKTLELFAVNGKVEKVKVDMGEPILRAKDVPVVWKEEKLINQVIDFNSEKLAITAVSMGNPHAVTFVPSVTDLELERIGKKIENDTQLFPEKTNVEFVEIIHPNLAKMRVWERGSGETQACGTGACASLVASVLNNKLDRKATIKLLGGDLELEWDEKTNHVFMTGEAVEVFNGEISLS
jgi:diaminopimelate epimerase